MLSQISDFFEQYLAPKGAASDQDQGHRVRLAVAALLLEVTRMDETVRPEECAAVAAAVRDRFGLDAGAARQLMDLAEAERHGATDYFQFTSLINKHYSPEERVQLVEQLWQVAFADTSLHSHEEHLVRKLAQLLHVPHSAFIAAKHRTGGAL